jgi:hypothetical protein
MNNKKSVYGDSGHVDSAELLKHRTKAAIKTVIPEMLECVQTERENIITISAVLQEVHKLH